MPASHNQRARPLYVMKILLEKTDIQNTLSMNELLDELAAHDITAERKSIYSDLETLKQYGLDIKTIRSKTTSYYISNRQFELPELKLLVDAVQSSRFITKKESDDLISKLSSLASLAQSRSLKRKVYVSGRPKSSNEQTLYNVDVIHSAIIDDKAVAFKYFDYDVRKKRVFRKDGAVYLVTPVSLCWDSDKYYLVAFSTEHNDFRHYRVDRMSDVALSDEPTADIGIKGFNIAEYSKRMFGMYGGEVIRATLMFDNALVNVVLDYFGSDVVIIPQEAGQFEVSVDVSVSPVFLAWIFQFGKRAEVKSPNSLISAMKKLLEENMQTYSEKPNK